MLLTFKNSHIYFAIDSIWANLNYKFKYVLNEAITANSDDDYTQTLDVPVDILLQIFSTVTVQPEGVAAFINQQMLQNLVPQIMANSNLPAVMAGTEQPNESAALLIAISHIDTSNTTIKAAKILSGKNKILQ